MNLKIFFRALILLFIEVCAISKHHHREPSIQKISKHTRRHLLDQPPSPSNSTSNNVTVSVEQKGDQKCNPEVAKAFELEGTGNVSEKIFLEICGMSQQSCCTMKDQAKIVERWTVAGTEKNLQDRLSYHKQIVGDLYTQALEVHKRAKPILLSNTFTSSECLLMSRRIDALNLATIYPRIERNYKKMHDFLSISYKGVHCAVCDPKTNAYFLPDKKEAVVSNKFCRGLISSSLNSLLYNHVHNPTVGNLLLTFVDTCNPKGVFKMPEQPEKSPLTSNPAFETALLNCRKNRNSPNWYESCSPICNYFGIANFDEFFEPSMQAYTDLTKKLQAKLSTFSKPENSTQANPVNGTQIQAQGAVQNNPTSNPPVNSIPATAKLSRKLHRNDRILKSKYLNNRQRRLADPVQTSLSPDANSSPTNSTNGFQIFLNRAIFPLNSTKPLDFVSFKTKIKSRGIDLYERGLYAEITSPAANSGTAVEKVEQAAKRRLKGRKLKSATILSMVSAILALALFSF
jgi:hypothetical protein